MKLVFQIAGGVLLATTVICGALTAVWTPLMKVVAKSSMKITNELMEELGED